MSLFLNFQATCYVDNTLLKYTQVPVSLYLKSLIGEMSVKSKVMVQIFVTKQKIQIHNLNEIKVAKF